MTFSDIKLGDPFYYNGCLFYKHTKYSALKTIDGKIICFDGSETVY